jgi:hypothetical protein
VRFSKFATAWTEPSLLDHRLPGTNERIGGKGRRDRSQKRQQQLVHRTTPRAVIVDRITRTFSSWNSTVTDSLGAAEET